MPYYDYICRKCGRKFQVAMTISEHEGRPPRCPKCRSGAVEQRIAPFFTKTSKKS